MRSRGVVDQEEMVVVGIAVRTCNRDEEQQDTSKIPGLWAQFFGQQVTEKVSHKAGEGHTLELYTDYDGDEHDAYTVVLGFRVTSAGDHSRDLVVRTIPAGKYAVFTSERGSVAHVVRQAWREIWSLDAEQLGGSRTFIADYEVFDERSNDPEDAEVDIFVAVDGSGSR